MSLKSTPDHIVITIDGNLERMQREKAVMEEVDTGYSYHIEYASRQGAWVLYKKPKETARPKYLILLTFEGLDNCQFYEGHDHSFEEKLVACCHFAIPARPLTYNELKDEILAEVNTKWFTVEEGEVCGRETRAKKNDARQVEGICMSCSLLIIGNQQIIKWWNRLMPMSLKKADLPNGFPVDKSWEELDLDQKKEVVRVYIRGMSSSPDDFFRTKGDDNEPLSRWRDYR